MAIETIYLHVGGDKTGSTYLQSVLCENQNLLADYGYCYPPTVSSKHHMLTTYFCADPMRLDYVRHREAEIDINDIDRQSTHFIDEVKHLAQDDRLHTMILSDEGLFSLNDAEFRALEQFLRELAPTVRPVYYLRPYYSYAISAMTQRIKFGIPAWQRHPPIVPYWERISRLIGAFGRRAITLRCYDKTHLVDADIVNDFGTLVCMNETLLSSLNRDGSRDNISYSAAAVQVGDVMTRLLAGQSDISGGLFRDCFDAYFRSIDGPPVKLTPYQATVIDKMTAPEQAKILDQFGIDLTVSTQFKEAAKPLSDEEAEQLARAEISRQFPQMALPTASPIVPHEESQITDATGDIVMKAKSHPKPNKAGQVAIDISITNRSAQWWGGDIAPVNISYHWRDDQGADVVFDGLRTALPDEGIDPGQTLRCSATIALPSTDGTFELEITLVQEFFGWFETKGLITEKAQFWVNNGEIGPFS